MRTFPIPKRRRANATAGQAQGYNAEQIGVVLAWTGLPQLILIPQGRIPDGPAFDPESVRMRHQRRSDCAPITFSLAWQATRHNVASAEASPRPAR
jgi:hypothetical protein